MASARIAPRRSGFTLVEVLVSLFLVAIAVFPMLEIIQRAEVAAFDAKFTSLACGTIRNILSDITANARAGDFGQGDLSTITEEQGYDERFAFATVSFEWEVEAVDLSSDIVSDDEEEEDGQEDPDTDPIKDPDQDEQIDERFRARYVRIVLFYELDSGEQREMIVETFLPPLPKRQRNVDSDQIPDAVPPNPGN